jgi:hypothetical protein
MDSFILEDVNLLLKLKKGDLSRLNQIKEICETNGIISLSDRKYVERLSSQYIQKNEKVEQKPDKPKFIPIEETPAPSKTEVNSEDSRELQAQLEEEQIPEISTDKSLTKSIDFFSNKKIIYSIGAIVLAIILIGVVAISYDNMQLISSENPSPSVPKPNVAITIESDNSSYGASDIISISGIIAEPGSKVVRVSIENEQGKMIWAENLDLKNNGEFSTLALAGGVGWENSGKYSLIAEYEELTEKISFDFEALK